MNRFSGYQADTGLNNLVIRSALSKVARLLERPEGTVKYLLHALRGSLRRLLGCGTRNTA